MKKFNFAIMIKTHKRAETQLTYNTLKRCNYKGKIYLIVDDEDEQLEIYKSKYKDEVIVFSKDKVIKKADTIDNFNNKKNALLPAIYCKELANELKLDYYMIIDDDIEDIRERYVQDYKLKGRDVKDLNTIINLFINYMDNTNISCLSFGNQGGYIGGLNGKFKNGMGRNNNQNFIIKTKDNINFIGTRNEDFNTLAHYSNIGKLIFEIYKIGISSPERGSNTGGLQEDYEQSGMYVANFYSIIVAPYCCKICSKNGKIILKRNWDKFAPKILNEVYKK